MPDLKQLLKQYEPKEVKRLKPEQQLAVLRFSPCGKMLAAGTFEGQVLRWDASTAAFASLTPLTGQGGWVEGLAFHPDGKRLFTADSWGALRAWSYADGKCLWTANAAHDGWIRELIVSPDGKQLATCGRDHKIRLWSPETRAKTGEMDDGDDVLALAFAPDGKSLVSGNLHGAVKQWDLTSKKVVRTLDAKEMYFFERLQDVGGVRCFAFDAKGETLAVGGAQPKSGGFVTGMPLVLFFDWKSGILKHKTPLGTDNGVYLTEMVFHSDGFLMAVTSGQAGLGRLLFLRSGDAVPFFSKPLANCHSLHVHPNGKRLAVCSTNANSAGNGAVVDKDQKYLGNYSPVHLFELPIGGSH
jgi:WD40 repeat protein